MDHSVFIKNCCLLDEEKGSENVDKQWTRQNVNFHKKQPNSTKLKHFMVIGNFSGP